MATARHVPFLRLIALFKLFKALVLLASLAILFNILHHDPVYTAITLGLKLHVDPGNQYLRLVLANILDLDATQFELLAAGTVLYAVLFLVEGTGLWFEQVWAEYLTIVATASFIPIELYEIITSISSFKTVTLALNIAIVVYLVIQVRHQGACHISSTLDT
jgi:uncharacterized membrane protein (DUF2068 family)